MRCSHALGVAALAAAAGLLVAPAHATVYIYPSPALATIPSVGQTATIDIVADVDAPIVAWGFDLTIDDLLVAALVPGGTTWGPGWTQVATVDGDGFAGLSFPNAQSGNGIVLFSVTFIGMQQGTTGFDLSYTPGDETEGVGYESGLADVVFTPGVVEVLPEPASMLLLVLGGLALRRRRTR